MGDKGSLPPGSWLRLFIAIDAAVFIAILAVWQTRASTSPIPSGSQGGTQSVAVWCAVILIFAIVIAREIWLFIKARR